MAGEEPQRKRARNPKEPVVVQAKDPSQQPGELRRIGGSMSDDWNNRIANDTVSSLWLKNSDEATRDHQWRRPGCATSPARAGQPNDI